MKTEKNCPYNESLFERISQKSVREWWMGIAIILVIMHHFCIWHEHSEYFFFVNSIFVKGDIGVNIFLFFSAFGLCFSYESNRLSHFYYKRAIRIVPLYVIALLIVCYLPPPFDVKIDNVCLLLIKQLTGLSLVRGGVEWYLSALILFYLFFPLVFKLCVWVYARKHYLFFIPLLLIFSEILYERHLGYNFLFINFFARFVTIVCGCLLFICRKNSDYKTILIFFSICSFLTFFNFHHTVYPFVPLVLIIFSSVCDRLPMESLFCSIGKYTLEIYLAQFVVVHHIYRNLNNNEWIDITLCTLLTVIMTFFFVWINRIVFSAIRK